uniref:Uncharacterized protein n=1 Tax=Cannabis sativa TaxID=3483 RepID=A0A803P3J3_CANSA
MENVVSMSISTDAINLPTSVSLVASEVVTSPTEEVFTDTHPCLAIVLLINTINDPPSSPRSTSPPSSMSPPVSQKPRTFQGKAPPLSKKASTSSSLTKSISKRVTRSTSSSKFLVSPVKPACLPKSKLIGPPHPPSKVSYLSKAKKKVKKN